MTPMPHLPKSVVSYVLASLLAVGLLLALGAGADRAETPALAGSGSVVIPDVGAAWGEELNLEAGSGSVVIPDVGAAPVDVPSLAGSGTVVIPDVGSLDEGRFLAGSGSVVIPDVG